MSKKKKNYGWDFLNSSKSGTYNGDDGSYGYKNSDGSGSWNGADGSWGYKNSDGSGSWNGADGSWGTWNSDGTSSYYGKNNETDEESFDFGSKLASGLAGFLTGLGNQVIDNSNKKKAKDKVTTKSNEENSSKF